MAVDRPSLSGLEPVGDLFRAGFDGLQVTCRGCRKVTCFAFRLLSRRHGVRVEHLAGEVALRLVCRSCRLRVGLMEDVRPWRNSDGQPP